MHKTLADELVLVPRAFRDGNRTLIEIVAELGYFETPAGISETSLRSALEKSPEVAGEWLAFSADKRTREGWYVRQLGDDLYEVGRMLAHGTVEERRTFRDKLTAIAAFIKRELDTLRDEDGNA
jgi:hypothetical protein